MNYRKLAVSKKSERDAFMAGYEAGRKYAAAEKKAGDDKIPIPRSLSDMKHFTFDEGFSVLWRETGVWGEDNYWYEYSLKDGESPYNGGSCIGFDSNALMIVELGCEDPDHEDGWSWYADFQYPDASAYPDNGGYGYATAEDAFQAMLAWALQFPFVRLK